MSAIFLSASVPLPERHEKFRKSLDVVGIRDAVRALVSAASNHKIVFGGHPAITPIIRHQMEELYRPSKDHFVIFQSRYHIKEIIEDVQQFEHVVYVDAVAGNKDQSVELMRREMITSDKFIAAFFIGGMEGIFEEYEMFRKYHPNASIFPLASTGGATELLFERYKIPNRSRFEDTRYLSLCRRLITEAEKGQDNGTKSFL
jgi:hypothetical protein